MVQSCCAIIPARGGSQGVSRKNVRPIAGVALIERTVRTAHAATRVQQIHVSTDDAEVADIAKAAGASIIERPEALATDCASSESALLHALDVLEARDRTVPDLVVFLQCTSPLTTAAEIDGAIEMLERQEADSVVSVVPFRHFVWETDSNGSATGVNHDKTHRQRRQDRPPQFVETGSVYVMRTEAFRAAGHRFFGRTVLYVNAGGQLCEIDEARDLNLAEFLARDHELSARVSVLPQPVHAVVMDFDGVHTNNRVWITEDAIEMVACSRSDGMGIEALRREEIPLLVLSKESNPVVASRCAKLQVECIQGCADKAPTLRQWLSSHDISPRQTVFVGNDTNDVACLKLVGCGAVVADAHPQAMEAADLVLTRTGGNGALRELADLILTSAGQR